MRPVIITMLPVSLFMATVCASWGQPFVDEAEPLTPSSVEDKDLSWKEGATSLPPWPNDGDLVELFVDDPGAPFRQYVDGRHISVGADGAVRYTLVVESRSGARNVSFEGLRCTPSGAFKIYAYGYDGRFEKVDSDWIPIRGRSHDKIHRDLHELILCIPRKFEPRPREDMIRAMRTRVLHEAGTGFVPD